MYFWKKSTIDAKNRIVLPQELRQYLQMNGNKQILWISAIQKDRHSNEYIIEIGVRK